MLKALYHWLPILFFCHCRSDRSFFWHGKQFPLCARCTGQLAGLLLGIPVRFFYALPVPAAFCLLLPLVLDGSLQALTRYESNNPLRLATGLLFGFGLYMLTAASVLSVFRWGYQIGAAWRT